MLGMTRTISDIITVTVDVAVIGALVAALVLAALFVGTVALEAIATLGHTLGRLVRRLAEVWS